MALRRKPRPTYNTSTTGRNSPRTSYVYVGDSSSLTNTKLEIEPPPNSTTKGVNRLYFSDALGRLAQVQENVTSWHNVTYGQSPQPTFTTAYGYDVLDDLTSVVAQSGQSRNFSYDSLKRLVYAYNPESGSITYSYDTSSNLSTRTDANSTVLSFSAYDGMNRATGKSYSLAQGSPVAPTPSVSYTYGDAETSCNLRGLLMQVTASSTPSMANNYTCYDWAGRPLSSNQVTGDHAYGMSYLYDLAGLMTSFTLPSGRQQSIAYDTAGRASGVSGTYGTTNTTYASAFAYFPNSALQNVSLGPNSLTQQYCQNSRLQIVAVRLAAAGGGLTGSCGNSSDPLNLGFAYGSAGYNNGNLTAELLYAPLNVIQTFSYDAYNRISEASEGSAWSQNYKYDVSGNSNLSLGNRYVSAYSGIAPLSFTPQSNTNFNSNNQLIIQSSSYDNAGNLKVIGGYDFTYDAENRQVTNTVNGTTTYVYDGEGHRVEKVSGNVTTVYVYDAKGEVAAEYSTSPATPTETQYLTGDHLGSTRLVTNAAGTVLGYHDYLPFGEEISAGVDGRSSLWGALDGVTQKFTAKERDAETASSAMQALDYFGARYFSGTMGRFSSPDPISMATERLADPQEWNMYEYARNSPLRYTDPTGMYTCADSHKCDSALDKAFEGARQVDLRSNDKATGNAAKAYGEKNSDNGVSVAFASVLPAACGDQAGCVQPRVKGDNSGNILPDLTVTFKLGQQGTYLDSVVAHEGVHVEDNLNFINSFVAALGTFEASENFTHGQTEFKGYQVQLGVLLGLLGRGKDYSVLGQVFSPKDLQSQIDSKIMQGLADPANGYASKLNELQYDPKVFPQK